MERSVSKGWDGDESRRVMKTAFLKGRDGMPKIKALGNEPGEMRVSHLSPTRPGDKITDDPSKSRHKLMPTQKQVKDTLSWNREVTAKQLKKIEKQITTENIPDVTYFYKTGEKLYKSLMKDRQWSPFQLDTKPL